MTTITNEIMKRVRRLVLADRRIAIREQAKKIVFSFNWPMLDHFDSLNVITVCLAKERS